jgi:ligand-binding sensor domain-containing protein
VSITACAFSVWHLLVHPSRQAGVGLPGRSLAPMLMMGFFCLCGSLPGEPARPSADSGYTMRAWGREEGLPENSATAVVQTRDGYLWLGTWNGLVRFNGDRFTVFDPRNTPQLPSEAIVNLHADRRDRLWVSTLGGLVIKDGAAWRTVGLDDGWRGNHVRTFTERQNGDLLLTTFDGHVLLVENDRLIALPPPRGEAGQGYFGAVDESGRWWLAQNLFVGYWDGRQWVQAYAPGAEVPRSRVAVAAAHGGGVWVLLGR